MIKKFIERCNENSTKDAFRYLEHKNLKSKTYGELLNDIYKMCNLFNDLGIKKGDKAIVFVMPSYEMYALMLAGLMYGINIVIMDSFKNKTKIKIMTEASQAKYLIVNKKTKFISNFIFNKIEKIDISNYYKYEPIPYDYIFDSTQIVLTTFTSGTTGIPKIINRTFKDFENQINVLTKNYDFNNHDVIICMLPIYVLFSLFNGNTTCMIKRIKKSDIERLKGDVLLGKIADILKTKDIISRLKDVYLGGAYIYKSEAQKIIKTFPNSKIHYTYGASEGVLIGINDLTDFYQFNRFKIVKDVNVEIVDQINNVGEIAISGQSVLGLNNKHLTGDIGYSDSEFVYIVGRKKYSCLDKGFYNYIFDQQIRNKYKIDKAFSIWYNNKCYVFVNKNLLGKEFIRVKKIPYDLKHQTKADYTSLINRYLK